MPEPDRAHPKRTAASPALDVRGVYHAWGPRAALKDVSFTIGAGELTFVLGPNGAGKTTLFNLITGLLPLQDGDLQLFGSRLTDDRPATLSRLGVVFQDPSLDLDLTAHQNLAYHGALHGLDRTTVRERGARLLDAVGLSDRAGERVRGLSGGMKRRLEIARALLHRPDLLILDEPTTGLDIPTRSQLIDHIHGLAQDEGIAVLWATHLIDEIRPGDRVLVLHQGRINADGTTDGLRSETNTDSLAAAFEMLTVPGSDDGHDERSNRGSEAESKK